MARQCVDSKFDFDWALDDTSSLTPWLRLLIERLPDPPDRPDQPKFLSSVFDRFAERVHDAELISLDKYTLHKSHLGLGPQDRLKTQKAPQGNH